MSDYSAKIAALETALASGELIVESDGDKVTYRNVTDLKSALEYFRSQQTGAAAIGGTARPASTVAMYDPGC